MDQQVIMIKCPHCGAVLSVKNQPGIESKNVPCPQCKQRSPFTSFLRVARRKQPLKGTVYPPGYEQRNPQQQTQQQVTQNPTSIQPGYLQLQSTGQIFRLTEGRNIIGRQAMQSSASLQIPTNGSMRMSREHLVIDVKLVPGKGYVHVASLLKPKHNKTCVAGQVLQYGDSFILNPGDLLELPDATLVFNG